MVKLPPRLWNPSFWLVALTVLFSAESTTLTYYGEEIPRPTEWLWVVSFGLLCAWWIRSDRRTRNFSAPFEFDAFVLFAWPVLVPYYLYRTRGRFGLVLGACVWLLYLAPEAAAWGVYLAFGEPR